MGVMLCYDAGLVGLGWAAFELPSEPSELPVFLDCGVGVTTLPSKKKRRGRRVTDMTVDRIHLHTDTVKRLHKRFKPVVYFSELPHSGARGAKAIRAMATAMTLLVSTLRVVAPKTPSVYLLPSDIKKTLTGFDRADKEAVEAKVRALWPSADLSGVPAAVQHNAIDAMAVCAAVLTHPAYQKAVTG